MRSSETPSSSDFEALQADWMEHEAWFMSTRIFEERIVDFCREAVHPEYSDTTVHIVRDLVQKLLEEPLKAIGVLIQHQRAKLQLVIRAIGQGQWHIGYHLDDLSADFSLNEDEIQRFQESTLSSIFPAIFLFVLKKFLTLASRYNLFEGQVLIAAQDQPLEFD